MEDSKKNYLKKAMLLHAVADYSLVKKGDSLYNQCAQAIEGGITLLQLKAQELSDEDFIKEGLKIKKLCHENNIKLIINNNLNVMEKIDADGIHLNQDMIEIKKVRDRIGSEKILGVTVQTLQESMGAICDGVDYLGIGDLFATTKRFNAVDVSPETLKSITRISPVATCGLGGIGLNNIRNLSRSGLNGVAIISAIFASDDIKSATVALKKKCEKAFCMNNKSVHIYDLDGTLIDSLGIWSDLASNYLRSKKKSPKAGLDDLIVKLSIEESAAYLKKEYDLKESVEIIRDEILEKVHDLYANSINLKPGAKEYVERMYNKGAILAVATASSSDLCKAVLKNNNLDRYFTVIKSEVEIGASKAKNTDICDSIIKELDASKEDTVVFEDAAFAIRTLKKNGYFTVGVYDGHNKEGISSLSDYYIEDFRAE